METYPELGSLLKRRREELGIKQSEVPGFKKTTMSRYESGERRPRFDKLSQLSQIYQLNFDELITLGHYQIEEKSTHKDLIQAAHDALATGDLDRAFSLATKLARTAQKTDSHQNLSIAWDLLKDIMARETREDLAWRAFKNFDQLGIEKLRTYAREHEDYPTARLTNTLLLKRSVPASDNYFRAVKNLAIIASIAGNFTQMESYSEEGAAIAQKRGEDNAYQFSRLYAEMARFLQGKLIAPHAVVRPPFWNPYIWRVYWWVVLHTAWIQKDWGFIAGGLKEAEKTYEASWGPWARYDLAGVEAALSCHRGSRDKAITRLQNLLVADLGMEKDVAFNIEEDLVHILVTHHHPQATRYWAPLVLRNHHQQCSGWVAYWLAPHRRPDPIVWDGISAHSQREVTQLLRQMDAMTPTRSDGLIQD